SLLLLLGQRGPRAAREQRSEATRSLATFLSVAALFGTIGVILLPSPSRWTVVVPLIGVALLGVWILRRREHTTAGEIVSGVALASLALPVGAAAGAPVSAAATCAAVYAGGFIVATICVRAVILVTRGGRRGAARFRGIAAAAIVLAALAWLQS